jgi:hypothetical protein
MISFSTQAKSPDCTHPQSWPAQVTLVELKNAGLLKGKNSYYEASKVVRLASEKIGKDLYRQVHFITFTNKTGERIQTITINDADHEECSVDGGDVYVISKYIKSYP